jgi:hypothetical protein
MTIAADEPHIVQIDIDVSVKNLSHNKVSIKKLSKLTGSASQGDALSFLNKVNRDGLRVIFSRAM